MNPTHALICSITLLAAAMASQPAHAQQDTDLALQRAGHLRMVDGDLDNALALYRAVALSAAASRAHVARALVEMGDTYQMMGSSEAAVAYERVLNEYTDQPEAFNRASAGIKSLALTVAAAPAGAAREHVLVMPSLPPFNPVVMQTYDFSPDGKQLVFHAPADEERKAKFPRLFRELYIQDTQGAVRRPLLADAGEWEFINVPRWSPDGKRILMMAYASSDSGGRRQFMVHELGSGNTIAIVPEGLEKETPSGMTWMPDNESFLAQYPDGYRVFGLDGKLLRHHTQAVDHMTRIGNVSPDGRQLLFQQVDATMEDHDEMDIWALDLETGESSVVVKANGFDGWPTWGADGSYVYFVSGAEGSRNVFRVKPGSQGAPEQLTAYSNATVTYPQVLPDGGQLVFTLMKDNNTVMLQNAGGAGNPRMVARGTQPMLAPDGKHLYYFGTEPGLTGLWMVATEGGEPRQLIDGDIRRSYGPKSYISPDGTSIALAHYRNGVTELLTLPAAGGAPAVIYSTEGKRHLIPSWSVDSQEIAFSVDGTMFVIPAGGGEAAVLAEAPDWESWSIEWSPDGKTLAAFAYLQDEPNNHIMLIDRATGEMRRLTPPEEGEYKEILAWHPSGQQISYMYYNTEDNNGSRVIDVATGEIRDLSDLPEPMWDYVGIWGPDGRYYFGAGVRGMGNDWSVHAFDPASGNYETILKKPGRSMDLPTWSSDGKLTAWAEQEPIRQLWMMTGY
jgi:Tol biopolymer transport system component